MLGIPAIADSIVGVTITPRTLTCSWIQPSPDTSLPYTLKAYKHMLHEPHEKNSLVLYNPTRVRSHIVTFLQLHELEDSLVVFALAGNGMTEKQLMLAQPAAQLKTIEQDEQTAWQYFRLQDNPNLPQSPWYCCGITRSILFQYQLLAIQTEANVVQITTPTMALIKAYRHIKGSTHEVGKPGNHILEYVNLNGQLRLRSSNEHAAVVESFGLFLLGNELMH